MADKTGIARTDSTWQVTSGCRECSPGCVNCYATRQAHRMGGNPNAKIRARYHSLTVVRSNAPRWTGEVRELVDQLAVPLRWREPRRVFVDSLSDLFQDGVSPEFIAAVFGVMAACPRHTFHVLTKRPERMRQWIEAMGAHPLEIAEAAIEALGFGSRNALAVYDGAWMDRSWSWPLANVWLGASIEDQARAEERIPHLLAIPAAVRFLSCEPLLEPVRLDRLRTRSGEEWDALRGERCVDARVARGGQAVGHMIATRRVDWVIVGGESGPRARPFDLEWAHRLLAQGQDAGVPCFAKQTGDDPTCGRCGDSGVTYAAFKDDAIDCPTCEGRAQDGRLVIPGHHGADPMRWPRWMRVRQFPDALRGRRFR